MKRFGLLLSALLLAGAVAAQTLVYGLSGFPTTLDSIDAQDGNSLAVAGQITETLVFFEPGTTNLVPRLATGWEANADATEWTFTLREGVSFHDGTPFNAEAVKFTFDRVNDNDHPYAFRDEGKNYVPWGWVFGGPAPDGILSSVEIVDDYTVKFNMAQPTPFLPTLLAAIYMQIDSPAAVMAAGADYGTPSVGSVGTGAFVFEEWREGELVRMSRNDDYWGGAALVEEVVVRGIAEPTSRLAELQAGSIDIAVLLSSDDLQTVENDSDLKTAIPDAELNVGYLAMHEANAPFDNVLVRRAVAHAIDRQAIVDAFYEGLGSVAADHMPPSFFGSDGPWPYEYDPERAMELLAEAGFPDGFDTELWYMPVSRPYFPAPQPIAEVMATYLADVGINAQLMTEDWSTYLGDYNTGKFPMYMLGWNGDYADPDNFLTTFFGASAVDSLGWDAPDVVAALNDARQIADPGERAALYEFVNATVTEQAVSIPMAHNSTLNAVRTNIDGWVMSPLGYSSVDLSKVSKSE